MIKHLKHILLCTLLCLPWIAKAQSTTITVADGSSTNNYVPIYGLWCDESQHNQMLYPASMLTDLTGGVITEMAFYMSDMSTSPWGTNVTIRMMEVTNSGLNTLQPTTNATVVWTGTINGQNMVENIVLATPYVYLGGNLLIDVTTTAASWSSSSWYGVSHTGGAYYSYGSSSGTHDFLPKVTFTYQPAEGICLPPTGLSATTSGYDASISWNAGDGTDWKIVWGLQGFNPDNELVNFDIVTSNSYTITGLSEGIYEVYVRRLCDTNNSNWVMKDFMIGGCAVNIVGADSYGDGWNGGSLDIIQGSATLGSFSLPSGSSGNYTINVSGSLPVSFVWNSGSYDSEVSFEIYNFGNVLVYSASHPSADTVFTMTRPCSDCYAPSGLQIDSLASDYARLVWNGTTSSYGVFWGESADVAVGNGTFSTENDNYLEMSNLSAGTGYTVMVWGICDDDEVSDTVSYTFATIGEPVSEFPYTTGFEFDDDIAWSFVNDATNQWTIGSGEAHTGTNGLYISNDNGTTNSYNVSGIQFSYAYRPLLISSAGQYAVSFDWKAYGESNYDYLRAWIAPSNATFTSGQTPDGTTSAYSYTTTTPSGWIDLGGKMNLHSSWQTTVATPSLSAGNYFLVFMWANDVSGGSQPPAAVDNINIHELTCPQPENLTLVPHSNSVDLNWTSTGNEYGWEITISDTIVDYSSSNNYTAQGLEPYTYYHFSVRAICGDGDTSFATNSENIRTLVSCPSPTALNVDSVTTNEIFVSWTPGDIESSWEVSINDSVVGIAYNNDYYLSNLDINTTYTIKVRSLCDNGDTSSAATVNTRTLAGDPISIFPYFCGFEVNSSNENEASDWVLENGSQTNYWTVGSATNNGGSNALYITNDGTSYSYSTNSTSYVFAYAVFQFSAGEYYYSYDWKADGESSYDFIRAAVVPNTTELQAGSYCGFNSTSGMPTGGIALDGAYRLNQQGNWQTQSGSFDIPSNGVYKVVFMWRNDGFSGTQPPAAIDNISIIHNTCPNPSDLTATVNGSDVDFAWTDTASYSWDIVYGNSGFNPNNASNISTVYTNSSYVSNLADGFYDAYVRANCGNGDYSLWIGPVNFSIGITVMNMNAGNDSISTCSAIIYDNGGPNDNYGSNRDDILVIYPNDNTKRFKLWGYGSTESGYDHLEIYEGSQSTGTPIATIDGNNIVVDTVLTNGGPVTLHFHSDGGVTYSGFAIFLECVDMPSCADVANLAVVGSTSNTITLDWGSYTGNDYSWLVSYSTSPLSNPLNGTTDAVSSHPYTVTGLTPGTDYYFYVLNDCGGGDSSSWTMVGPVRPGVWTMQPNQVDTIYMCGGTIYDDGGPSGNYSSSQDSYVIIRPDSPNMLVSVSGTSLTEGSWDYLTIYDGIGTGGTELWTDYNVSSSQNFGPIESVSGPLTIAFHSDGSMVYSGFEINVSCVSTSCRVMNLVQDPSVAASSTQLAVTWDAVTDAQHYEIEYGVAGFIQGQGQTMNSTTNSAVISGLTALTNYDIYVHSICSGNESGVWSRITLQTAMCDNSIELYNYDASQSSSTATHFPIGYSYYNYSYVQTIIPASRLADLTGEITAFAFNPTSVTSGSSEFEGMTVWMANVAVDNLSDGFVMPDNSTAFHKVIDNASFSFSETGWQIQNLDTAFSWDGVSNVLVAVNRENGDYSSSPNFAAHVDTVARARYVYSDYDPYDYTTVSGGTASSTVGDIKLISCGIGCPRPNGLYATDVNYGSALLHWSGSSNSYEVAVKPATAGVWSDATVVNNATTYNVSGLTPATQYQFRVRTVCDAAAGDVSDWSVGSFTTSELPCMVPTDFHTVAVQTTSVTLAWTAVEGQDQWSIHVWNTAGGFDFDADSNPFTVTGLASNTSYSAVVKTICGNGAAESEYGDTITFTTSSCPQVTGVLVGNITSNSAVVSWNAVASAVKYIVEFGPLNFSTGLGTSITVAEGNSCTLSGLSDESNYSVYVMAVCGEGVNGSWSERVDFSTASADGISPLTADGNLLSIYPNPTSDATTITVRGISGDLQITIVDMNGRAVKEFLVSCDYDDCTKQVDVSGLAQGAYFVRVSADGVNTVKKLIVK